VASATDIGVIASTRAKTSSGPILSTRPLFLALRLGVRILKERHDFNLVHDPLEAGIIAAVIALISTG